MIRCSIGSFRMMTRSTRVMTGSTGTGTRTTRARATGTRTVRRRTMVMARTSRLEGDAVSVEMRGSGSGTDIDRECFRCCKEENISRIMSKYEESPGIGFPGYRAIEVFDVQIFVILPGTQHVAEVVVATVPAGAIEVVGAVQTHDVVEVNLIDCLILVVGQFQFVSHFVAQKEGIVLCFFVAHGFGRNGHYHHHCQHQKVFHFHIIYLF
jgi:hypothetical protein